MAEDDRPGWAERWIRRNAPTREGMAKNRWTRPFADRILRSELWRFTRRSVPRGVALGLFAGFIVPVGQIIVAAVLALPARANVPIAVLTTFITNPFTLPFWFWVANRTGRLVLSIDEYTAGSPVRDEIASGRWEQFGGFLRTAGVTSFGFVVLALVSSAVGYLVSSWVWRWRQGRRRRSMLLAMRQRRLERSREEA